MPEKSSKGKKEKVAGVTGLEPATSGVTGQRSNQLSYTPRNVPVTGGGKLSQCAVRVNRFKGVR